nr:MAG TPA: hypothetical protein [Caudoviricetes sp.]
MDKVIVIRHSDDQRENKEVAKISLSDDSTNNFEDYFLKYGKHFSPKLLKYALDGIENKDASNHRWDCQ